MFEYSNSRPVRIVGPSHEVLTQETLPPRPPVPCGWQPNVWCGAAVKSGLLTLDEALERYSLSLAEYYSWQDAMDRSGVAGLRVAAVQSDRTARRSRMLLNS
ncbi:MAG: DUF1153 domain-containing protein [Novosphingobium sp.]